MEKLYFKLADLSDEEIATKYLLRGHARNEEFVTTYKEFKAQLDLVWGLDEEHIRDMYVHAMIDCDSARVWLNNLPIEEAMALVSQNEAAIDGWEWRLNPNNFFGNRNCQKHLERQIQHNLEMERQKKNVAKARQDAALERSRKEQVAMESGNIYSVYHPQSRAMCDAYAELNKVFEDAQVEDFGTDNTMGGIEPHTSAPEKYKKAWKKYKEVANKYGDIKRSLWLTHRQNVINSLDGQVVLKNDARDLPPGRVRAVSIGHGYYEPKHGSPAYGIRDIVYLRHNFKHNHPMALAICEYSRILLSENRKGKLSDVDLVECREILWRGIIDQDITTSNEVLGLLSRFQGVIPNDDTPPDLPLPGAEERAEDVKPFLKSSKENVRLGDLKRSKDFQDLIKWIEHTRDQHPDLKEHVLRWNRVLAGLKVEMLDKSLIPMTSSEARRDHLKRGTHWKPVVMMLEKIESLV